MNAWWQVVSPFALLLFGAFLYAELSAYCFARGRARGWSFVTAALFVALSIWQYTTQGPSYAMSAHPFMYLLSAIWLTAAPLMVLAIGAILLANVTRPVARHLGLSVVSVAVVGVLPFFALWSLCASKVFCI